MPDSEAHRPVAARAISLAAAAGIALLVVFFEDVTGRPLAPSERYLVPILLLGAAAGLVHGAGIVPRHRAARALASPVVAWPVMAAGLWTLLAA